MSMRFRGLPAALTAAVVLTAAIPAAAANLIVNGDFEAGGGSTAGWTTTFVGLGNVDALTAADYQPCCGTFGSEPAYSSNHFAEFNDANVVAASTLSQTYSSVAGAHYTLSFDLGAFGSATNFMSVSADTLGQGIQASADNNADTTFQHYSFGFIGSGGLQTLAFRVASGPVDNTDAILDNVSLVMDRGAVPEPAAWALMLAGFAGAGAALRARRRTSLA